jgi:hypothetical protein
VPGRCYPVEIIHSQEDHLKDYVDAAIDTVLQIHTTQPAGKDTRTKGLRVDSGLRVGPQCLLDLAGAKEGMAPLEAWCGGVQVVARWRGSWESLWSTLHSTFMAACWDWERHIDAVVVSSLVHGSSPSVT